MYIFPFRVSFVLHLLGYGDSKIKFENIKMISLVFYYTNCHQYIFVFV